MDAKEFCPHCGNPQVAVVVHGHTQCSHCGKVISDCCGDACCQPGSVTDLADPDERGDY